MQKFRCLPSASRRSALLKVFDEHKLTSCQRSISNGNADKQQYSTETETHFGEAIVSEKEKSEKVKAVFERVASRYDLMNDLMSFGIHRVWKDMFISRLRPGRNTKLIDVAGGTGDIAFRFLKYKETSPADLFKDQNFLRNVAPFTNRVRGAVGAEVSDIDPENPVLEDKREDDVQERSVLVCDINDKMIEVGRDRAIQNLNADELRRIDWMVGDAENLEHVEDNTFDAYTIAFGIRNCVHVDQVLNEALRVLKPGGRFMCLEFSQVTNAALRTLYDEYSYQVIPPMGQVVAGDWDSYEYLVQSIRKFPNQEDFKHMIQAAGFRFVKYENLSGGICAIHSGFKL